MVNSSSADYDDDDEDEGAVDLQWSVQLDDVEFADGGSYWSLYPQCNLFQC